MAEKALATIDVTDAARHSGNFALVKTVHGESGLDTVVAPDGKLIVGVSKRRGEPPRTLNLEKVVADATDIVGQGGADARRSYGQVYVVVDRSERGDGSALQETLIDYPSRTIITNPGKADQHAYPADGLPQMFTTERPYQFIPRGGDPSQPKTSGGTVVAAYMHAPDENAAVSNFDPAAIARGDIANLTHAFVEPGKPLGPQGLQHAPVANIDPIAEAAAAANRIVNGPPGGGAQGALPS